MLPRRYPKRLALPFLIRLAQPAHGSATAGSVWHNQEVPGQLLALSQVILFYQLIFTVLLPVLLPVLFTNSGAKMGVFINGWKVETIVWIVSGIFIVLDVYLLLRTCFRQVTDSFF